MTVTIDDIRAAAGRAAGRRCVDTPCLHSRTLSEITGAQVYLKFENHQFTASFKERGALNKLPRSTPGSGQEGRHRLLGRQPRAGRGLPRHAAGHPRGDRDAAPHAVREGRAHAQARRRGDPARRELRRGQGARAGAGRARAASRSCIPTTTRRSIAGQGTIALEMLGEHPQLDIAGRRHRRRRPHRRHGHRGQGAQARHRGGRRRGRRASPSMYHALRGTEPAVRRLDASPRASR